MHHKPRRPVPVTPSAPTGAPARRGTPCGKSGAWGILAAFRYATPQC
jgi:hypothetical protein